MTLRNTSTAGASPPRLIAQAPEELTRAPLRRLGEGIGKIVYASEHWVVKRERSASAIIALIMVWKTLRRMERLLPGSLARRVAQRPGKQIRFLRVLMQAVVIVVPRGIWHATHIGDVWQLYRARDARGERLAATHLSGTGLIPERISFPPVRVAVAGWPGWLTVEEATERVESTLDRRLSDLARAGRYDELERWLNRFLDLRQAGWRMGVFSVDAHLKNFGVSGDRILLLDAGGLTNDWAEIGKRLDFEDVVTQPHIQLGLGPVLGGRPDIAGRFNARWKAIVNRDVVREHWPEEPVAAHNGAPRISRPGPDARI